MDKVYCQLYSDLTSPPVRKGYLKLFHRGSNPPKVEAVKNIAYTSYLSSYDNKKIAEQYLRKPVDNHTEAEKHDAIITDYMNRNGVEMRQITTKQIIFKENESLQLALMPVFTYNNLGSIGFFSRRKSFLLQKTQLQQRTKNKRDIMYFASHSNLELKTLTITPKQGYINPVEAKDFISSVKKQIQKSFGYLKRYGIHLQVSVLHLGTTYKGVRPHYHILYTCNKMINKNDMAKVKNILQKIGSINYGGKVKNINNVINYYFKLENFADLGSNMVNVLYKTCDNLRKVEYYSEIKKMRQEHFKDGVSPRYYKDNWVLVDKQKRTEEKKFLIIDKTTNIDLDEPNPALDDYEVEPSPSPFEKLSDYLKELKEEGGKYIIADYKAGVYRVETLQKTYMQAGPIHLSIIIPQVPKPEQKNKIFEFKKLGIKIAPPPKME